MAFDVTQPKRIATSLELDLIGRVAEQSALARTDEVTGLPNRRAWNERLQERVNSRHPLAVLILDIDKFKTINDTYGHPAGDMVLRQVAQIIKLRADDFVARIGGDEFGIILDTGSSHTLDDVKKQVVALIERINRQIDQHNFEAPIPFHLAIGADISLSPPHNIDKITRQSDQAMYHEKRK
jgi:diguanylate cyclase (GGDEF)-like protein